MTEAEVREKIEQAGGSWETFNDWMTGQTVGLDEDGTINYYEYDVSRFLRYKCNPKNEPLVEWD